MTIVEHVQTLVLLTLPVMLEPGWLSTKSYVKILFNFLTYFYFMYSVNVTELLSCVVVNACLKTTTTIASLVATHVHPI